MIFAGQDPKAPAAAPEGRFHHSGQPAIYTSLTPEGTEVAMRRYRQPEEPERAIVPLTLRAERLTDLRGQAAASLVWQDERAAGRPAPTWALSDAARAEGAQGLLYSSRSRPDLTHLVLFDLSPEVLLSAGAPLPAT